MQTITAFLNPFPDQCSFCGELILQNETPLLLFPKNGAYIIRIHATHCLPTCEEQGIINLANYSFNPHRTYFQTA